VTRQFDGYFIEPNIHHNGKLVLGESIGVLGGGEDCFSGFSEGTKQSIRLRLWMDSRSDQQFFSAWGLWRGDAIRPEPQRKMVQGDPHPIAKYRVIGPLSILLPAFAEAFVARTIRRWLRAPAERCEVW